MYNCVDKNIFILFQINDALFPIGAYSHYYGLETYIPVSYTHLEKEKIGFSKTIKEISQMI